MAINTQVASAGVKETAVKRTVWNRSNKVALSMTTTLPGSPTDGDIYIVPVGDPSENEIVFRTEGAWASLVPEEGWEVYVADEGARFRFDGADWVTLAAVPATYLDTDVTLAANSDVKIASQKATKTYADTKIPLSYLDTDTTLAANSDVKIASQKAVKAYADSLIAANDAMVFQGIIDCSANPNYPAADAGDTYRVSVTGKIGGGSGINVEVGDLLLCLADSTASGNQATVGTSWGIIQTNLDGAVIGPASAVSGNLISFNGTSGKIIQDIGLASTEVTKMRMSIFVPGIPTNQNGYIIYLRLDLGAGGLQFADDLPLCTCDSLVAATATATFNIKKNGSTIATVAFSAAGTTGAYLSTGAQSFAAGDFIGIEAPASPDATLAGVTFTLVGSRI